MNKTQEILMKLNILIHQIASAVEIGDTVDMSWVSRSTDTIETLITYT